MNFADAILAALALLSFVLLLWQWFAAKKFPLHKRVADSSFTPAISIFKPLKGCDDTTADSLRSWFNQDYSGPVQILFGVAEADDPVCEIVRHLLTENPKRDAQLLICEKLEGANAKVAKLAQLEKLAKHDLILVSDADVRVPPDFLANVVEPLNRSSRREEAPSEKSEIRNPKSEIDQSLLTSAATMSIESDSARGETGLVNCFYRLANPNTTAMQWEAVAINADFWSQVLQSQTLKPLDFALGAVMLVRRNSLEEIGGFRSLADCLADDYQLGHRLAKKGNRIALCPVVVDCWHAPMKWKEVWQHQIRWARTIRVCQPAPYFFSILSNATLWPLLWLGYELTKLVATTPLVAQTPSDIAVVGGVAFPCGTVIALAFLLVRIFLAQNLQRRLTPERKLISPFWLVPVKDLVQVVLWFGAFVGNTVVWRGRRMRLNRDGTVAAE